MLGVPGSFGGGEIVLSISSDTHFLIKRTSWGDRLVRSMSPRATAAWAAEIISLSTRSCRKSCCSGALSSVKGLLNFPRKDVVNEPEQTAGVIMPPSVLHGNGPSR